MNRLLAAALDYGRRSWRVFPVLEVSATGGCECGNPECDRPGKHPAINKWNTEATTDKATITKWWTEHPDRGIGIATGEASNLTVLDVDGDEGALTLAKLAAGTPIPATPQVQSRPGRSHYYFKFNPAINSSAKKLGAELDTRSNGGYVVAPPSRHATGGLYKWEQTPAKVPLAPWPEWLVAGGAKKADAAKPAPKERFNPANPLDVARLKSALEYVDFDDETIWGQVGWILSRIFNKSGEGYAIYRAWAAKARKFNANKTRKHYHEPPEAKGEVRTIASIYQWAKDRGWVDPNPPGEGHWPIAAATLARLKQEHEDHAPVYTMGKLWMPEDKLWVPMELRQLAIKVGEWHHQDDFCKRASDFKQIAQLAADTVTDEEFFQGAIVGIAGPKNLYVIENGKVRTRPLSADHRLRIRVNAEPDPKGEHKLFQQLLDGMFKDNKPQRELFQLLFGAGMIQLLWKFQIVALLYGLTNAGKSTWLKIFRSLFPPGVIATVGPQDWGNEYYRAELAGKLINLVGELNKKEFIPTGGFKIITGEDLVSARNPYGLPFNFTSTCSHFFNSNSLPPSSDHSDAFFRRWRILHFMNTTPEEKRIQQLAEMIVAGEMGYVIWWLLEGARKASTMTILPVTAEHTTLITKWRNENNSALAFINDPAECVRGPMYQTPGKPLFERYVEWCTRNRYIAFGRNGFYEALVEGGVRRTDPGHQPMFHDLCAIGPDGQLWLR